MNNKGEVLSIAFGFILCISSLLGISLIKGFSIDRKFDFDTFIKEITNDHLSVKAEVDCPFSIIPRVHITLQRHDEIWGSIYLNTKGSSYEECKSVNIKIESENGTPEIFDIQNYKAKAFTPDWLNDSSIEKEENSLVVSIKPKDFIGSLGFRVTGVQNHLTFSKREITLIASLTNGDKTSIPFIILMTQKRQVLLSTVPLPDKEATLGIMNGYEFHGDSFQNEFNNVVYAKYEDEESKETEELLLIILSTLIGIGAAGVFQGLISLYSK